MALLTRLEFKNYKNKKKSLKPLKILSGFPNNPVTIEAISNQVTALLPWY